MAASFETETMDQSVPQREQISVGRSRSPVPVSVRNIAIQWRHALGGKTAFASVRVNSECLPHLLMK